MPMEHAPKIKTAIPQRRYQFGDYGVTVLGEIESGDAVEYQFVAAFVREGEGQPRLYVVSEHLPPGQREGGTHALRVINAAMNEVLETNARWGQLDAFSAQALEMGSQLLGLEQETPYKLM